MLLMARPISSKLLLWIQLASLHTSCMRIYMRLPGWCSQKLDASRRTIVEDLLYFFERFLSCFWEQEQNVDEHRHTEDTEDDVDFPADIGECGRHEVGECEVECPIRGQCSLA